MHMCLSHAPCGTKGARAQAPCVSHTLQLAAVRMPGAQEKLPGACRGSRQHWGRWDLGREAVGAAVLQCWATVKHPGRGRLPHPSAFPGALRASDDPFTSQKQLPPPPAHPKITAETQIHIQRLSHWLRPR